MQKLKAERSKHGRPQGTKIRPYIVGEQQNEKTNLKKYTKVESKTRSSKDVKAQKRKRTP